MDINELELWWASLPVTRKEEIAKKGLTKGFANHSFDEAEVRYPACTRWWESLTPERKEWIYAHCTNRHGYVRSEWTDANPYGD